MRFLHTADWHLGRIFYGQHLVDDQAFVLEGQLFEIVQEQSVDALVIAGDVFDRSVPSLEGVTLWDRILTRLAAMKIPVFVVAGNHDSPERLAVGRSFYELEGIHIWGKPDQCRSPYIWESPQGPIAICPMPFAEPRAIYDSLGLEDVEDLKYDSNEMYRKWAQYLLEQVPEGIPSLAISHAFVAGASSAGSERQLAVGGSDYVQPNVFAGFTYTALGHIHNAQRAGLDVIRYAGSPLKYSFDEAHHNKSFTLVDISPDGRVSLQYIPVQARRDVIVIQGSLEDLMNDKILQGKHRDDYILAQLSDPALVVDGMTTLRKAYPRVLALELVGHRGSGLEDVQLGQYRKLKPRELFEQFATSVWGHGLSQEQETYMDSVWGELDKEEV